MRTGMVLRGPLRRVTVAACVLVIFGGCRSSRLTPALAEPPSLRSATATASPFLLAISVSNLDAALAWYGTNFGFRMLRRLDMPQSSLRIAFAELNGFQLELIEFRNSVSFEAIAGKFPGIDDRAKVQGFTKLAFRVEDIRRAATELEGHGVRFVRRVTRDESTGDEWLIVEDPDGNWIQLFGPKKRP